MKGKFREPMRLAGGEWLITFTTREDPRKILDRIGESDAVIDIKKDSPKRSLDANAFCWALCADIGKALRPPVAKEEVYRMAIRAVGVFSTVRVIYWDVETIRKRWSTHGVGWFVDVVDDAGAGHKWVNLYYGSSTYTVNEMQALLDWLVDQCEQMGIPLRLSREEEERVLKEWEKASCNKTGPAISAAG